MHSVLKVVVYSDSYPPSHNSVPWLKCLLTFKSAVWCDVVKLSKGSKSCPKLFGGGEPNRYSTCKRRQLCVIRKRKVHNYIIHHTAVTVHAHK
jgi:hypothetical protein